MDHVINRLPELNDRQKEQVRKIVREELVRAFGMLAREADSLDVAYETPELDSRALENVRASASGVVDRLECAHEEYQTYGDPRKCRSCGEPEPEPVNPFEDQEDSRG